MLPTALPSPLPSAAPPFARAPQTAAGGPFAALRAAWRTPRSPRAAALLLAAWLVVVAHRPLWALLGRLAGQGEMGDNALWLAPGIGLLVFGVTAIFLLLFAWPRVFKPAAAALLLLAGSVQYYMVAFGIVVDPGMVANVLQTNMTEVRDQFGWGLIGQWLLVAGLPLCWLLPMRFPAERPVARLLRHGLLLGLMVGLTTAGALGLYRQVAPLMRNHMELRFMMNPVNPVLSTLQTVTRPWRKHGGAPLVHITAGTALGPSYAAAGTAPAVRPPLFLLVVGETARADHFGLNGYERDTTPELARRGVTSFTAVRSCGTNTLHSVPCMFSPLGKAGWEARTAEHENLTDVLQAAGLAVLWLDNQAGCKGVCDRIPHASTADAFAPAAAAAAALCHDGECLDEVMLAGLDERIAALPAERRARGVVVVMHQMGSHGPAYWRRSAPENKRFQPECATHALAQCDHQALINVYDNSIAETDRFLARTIDWLGARRDRHTVGMLYLSDHGESLGEYGLFLHGMPYALAPDVQKHVPMVLWLDAPFAARTGTDAACVGAGREAALTHDNLYPTVLGLLDVRTPTYRRPLDAFAACRPQTG
ncbi:sulfatase-like hydrolase/transferase [uncultured Xylophilus sp.]|uniref:phosphoethanolamine transferase n=1 Tax=uncultured Xylophilus sp. TaxID=296832 RepID=UPI0025D1ECCE|nr:sulfatase-like hydrolase/transferase [uncultured Xylophilus sp.]